tara:strand:- start:230 stop:394 length:165 start_codon:yes stop_codon:yes gene_type:complete
MKYYAFDLLGECLFLDDCDNYEAARKIADVFLGEDCAFIYSSKEILELAKRVGE